MDLFLRRAPFLCLLAFASIPASTPALGAPVLFPPNPQPEISSAAVHAQSTDPRLKDAYKFREGGWTYVHLEGTPEEVGFQHGYLLAREIEDNVHVYTVTAPHEDKRPWSFFKDAAKSVLWPHIEPEYQAELKGIVEGLHAIDQARRIGAKSLFLGSNSRLKSAVHLYESVGFRHVPPESMPPMPYSRANVFMELPL